MTKKEMKAFIDSVICLRDLATDEQALNVTNLYPTWKIDVNYTTGNRVLYDGTLYRVLQDHMSQESWTPIAAPSLFAKVLVSDDGTVLDWEQPDSTNPYMAGDKVTHNGVIYVSTIDNNVWEPGVYGWEVVA